MCSMLRAEGEEGEDALNSPTNAVPAPASPSLIGRSVSTTSVNMDETSRSESFSHAMETAKLLLQERAEFRELLAGVFTVMRHLPSHELRDLCFSIMLVRALLGETMQSNLLLALLRMGASRVGATPRHGAAHWPRCAS